LTNNTSNDNPVISNNNININNNINNNTNTYSNPNHKSPLDLDDNNKLPTTPSIQLESLITDMIPQDDEIEVELIDEEILK